MNEIGWPEAVVLCFYVCALGLIFWRAMDMFARPKAPERPKLPPGQPMWFSYTETKQTEKPQRKQRKRKSK